MQFSANWLIAAFSACFLPLANAQWSGTSPITTSSNVGIGTTTPGSKLHVKGFGNTVQLEATGTYNYLTFRTTGGGRGAAGVYTNANDMDFGTALGNSTGKVNLLINAIPKFTLASNGYVGIGTTTPNAQLHLKGTGYNPVQLETTNADNYMTFYASNAYKGYAGIYSGDNDMDFGTGSSNSTGKVNLTILGAPKLTVAANGFAGIGTTTPGTQLHVKGSGANLLRLDSSNPDSWMAFYSSNDYKGYAGVYSGDNDMDFGTGNTNATGKVHLTINGYPKLTVAHNGNVGIGTTGPQAQLHVRSDDVQPIFSETTNPDNIMVFHTAYGYKGYLGVLSNDNDMDFGMTNSNSTGNVNLVTDGKARLTVFANGNVGIGTSSNEYALSVNGTIRSKQVRVETGWADYVFDNDFRLRPLAEVEAFIQDNKHLPDVTPAAEIQKNGLEVAQQMTEMMQKIEELTLYVIQLDKENAALRTRIGQLEAGKK